MSGRHERPVCRAVQEIVTMVRHVVLTGNRVAGWEVLQSKVDQFGRRVPTIENISSVDDRDFPLILERPELLQGPDHRGVPIRFAGPCKRRLVRKMEIRTRNRYDEIGCSQIGHRPLSIFLRSSMTRSAAFWS